MNRLYVGIDPGASGGIAVISDGGSLSTYPMPEYVGNVWKVLATIHGVAVAEQLSVRVTIEQVGGYVKARSDTGEGGEQPGSSMFNFGVRYGHLQMAMVALGLEQGRDWKTVVPQVWQRTFGMKRDKREPKSSFKKRLHAVACSLFPGTSITLKAADAVLLAEHGRRQFLKVFQ